ncbi:acyl-CoA dehydrogenase [Nonomuraea sp. NPDC003804]|uniref:Rv1679 family acyl-CoA dehydrogenase n=1 Tax=Nonomuraea sp. NPDC003804 TaxID=3154547 RepID=UPI0033AE2F0D
MDLSARLEPVLDIARQSARTVDADGGFPVQAVDAVRRSGLLGLTLPPRRGGLGGGPEALVEVLSSLAAVCGSTAMVYLMHVSAAMAVAAAPPSGHPALLERLASDCLATLAFSEAGSRSHFWAPVSQARREGDTIAVRAAKSWVTSAGHAQVYVVSTLAPDGEQGAVDLYAVFAENPGVEVAGSWRGLGLRGNASSPMRFEVLAGDRERIGEPGGGFPLMLQSVMPWFNLGNAAVSLGLAQAAVDAAVTHASGVRFQHTGEGLADLPTIRAQLSRIALDLAMARAYVEKAARSLAAPDDSTMLHVLGVKAAANDMALRVTDTAMRVCGGAAFSEHLQLERFFRDARAGHVMAPTADVLYDFYGKAITGRELF